MIDPLAIRRTGRDKWFHKASNTLDILLIGLFSEEYGT